MYMFWAGEFTLEFTYDSARYSPVPRDAHAHANDLLRVKPSVIRTFVMEQKCPDYRGSTVYTDLHSNNPY